MQHQAEMAQMDCVQAKGFNEENHSGKDQDSNGWREKSRKYKVKPQDLAISANI